MPLARLDKIQPGPKNDEEDFEPEIEYRDGKGTSGFEREYDEPRISLGGHAANGVHEFLFVLGQPRFKGSVQAISNPIAIH